MKLTRRHNLFLIGKAYQFSSSGMTGKVEEVCGGACARTRIPLVTDDLMESIAIPHRQHIAAALLTVVVGSMISCGPVQAQVRAAQPCGQSDTTHQCYARTGRC